MPEKIVMDFDEMEKMIQNLTKTAKELENTDQKMRDIATRLEGGALTGQAGDALRDGIRQRLSVSIRSLRDAVASAENFCKVELQDMRQAIESNKKLHRQ